MLHFTLIALLTVGEATDAERAAWRYKRQVMVDGDATLASLTLPPELSTRAGPSGRDFRLVDQTGRETPYLLDWTSEREGLASWRANVTDIRREKESGEATSALRSQWTIDLGEARTFTELSVDVGGNAFAWHVRLEASTDGDKYDLVKADAALFDQTWNHERVRQTDIRFDAPLFARYLRLSARSVSGSRTLELQGASVTLRRRMKGDQWSLNVTAAPSPPAQKEPRNMTRYRLEASSLLPFDEVEVICEDPVFSRLVRLIETRDTPGNQAETILGEGRIFRLRADDAVVKGESARFRTHNGSGGALFLEIDNQGSPALRGLRVRILGSRVRLLFPVESRSLTLYYGNVATRAPVYDLESLRPRLNQAQGTTRASLGDEELNPLFKREPPLRFAATLGASLDPSGWRYERPFAPIREEDVYAMTLRASDLAVLRPDLADLRVVDGDNRQVPFLIDHHFAEERVLLRVQKETSPPRNRSLYRLSPQGLGSVDHAPRISRIEIDVSEPFFERRARFLPSRGEAEREVPFSLALARRPGTQGPLSIGTSAPLMTLTLEVDDGDNTPLDIRSATAIVGVPRIVFKSAPGDLRLLLGHAQAEAPRYDITSLRSELLAYSAVVASGLTLTENKGAASTFRPWRPTASRGALVWAAIIIAIIILLGITVRTLKAG